MSSQKIVKVGVLKYGCVGTAPLLEYLLDERADREDITVRVVSSGAKLTPEEVEEAAVKIVEFNPDFVLTVSPNAALPGPKRVREILAEKGLPLIVISDAPAKKIAKELDEKGFGYIIVDADPMIGARREFLDPVEMALFNADIIRVLAITGVYRLIVEAVDNVIEAFKRGEKPNLPRIIVTRELAMEKAGFQNPYAKAKAMAAYEIAKKVADLSIEGCFKIQERSLYIPIVAAAHEMLAEAAKLAMEAREIEKYGDYLLRIPHAKDGSLLLKLKLAEKPERK